MAWCSQWSLKIFECHVFFDFGLHFCTLLCSKLSHCSCSSFLPLETCESHWNHTVLHNQRLQGYLRRELYNNSCNVTCLEDLRQLEHLTVIFAMNFVAWGLSTQPFQHRKMESCPALKWHFRKKKTKGIFEVSTKQPRPLWAWKKWQPLTQTFQSNSSSAEKVSRFRGFEKTTLRNVYDCSSPAIWKLPANKITITMLA